jgi:muramoyltetrapeptide carboxypeptidase
VAAALGGAATAVFGGAVSAAPATQQRLVKPRRLKEGDLVGLIAPGGAMRDDEIELAVRNIESMGLRVKMGASIGLKRGNYAGTPYQQVMDLHEMFLDKEVHAVWSGRGGSGCSLLLPLVDYRLVRAHAKVFVGFSDTTALHLAILRHAGLVTFHGPAGVSTFSPYSKAHLRAAFMDPRPGEPIVSAEGMRPPGLAALLNAERTIRAGVATGPLVGGNLAVLTALVGTPYAARLRGAIAFFEDINEPPYRVNRMLTQLVQSGELRRAAGVMFGICRKCSAPDDEPSLSFDEVLADQLEPLGIPAASGLSFGHVPFNFTIPLGVRARFDATARTLTLLESAVHG